MARITVIGAKPDFSRIAPCRAPGRLLRRCIAVVRRPEHPLDIPRNYVESGGKRLSDIGGGVKGRSYTVRNTVMSP